MFRYPPRFAEVDGDREKVGLHVYLSKPDVTSVKCEYYNTRKLLIRTYEVGAGRLSNLVHFRADSPAQTGNRGGSPRPRRSAPGTQLWVHIEWGVNKTRRTTERLHVDALVVVML